MKISGVVLFPGAGSNKDHSCLVAIEKTLVPVPVRRVDFPYRRAGKKAPDRAPVLLTCVRGEVQQAADDWGVPLNQILIGGRSMGGRMCSMAIAGQDGEPLGVGALVCISYPLHPPGKPEKLRIEHLPKIKVPTLFVHGTKDPFASPEELKQFTKAVKGKTEYHFVEGGRHDIKNGDTEVANAIAKWIRA